MNSTDEEKKFGLLLEKKIFFAAQYLSATKEMKEALMLGKEKNIMTLLSKRQDCINKIKKIDRSIQNIISSASDRFGEIFNNYLDHIKILFEQIVPIDENMMLVIKAESKSIKEDLLKMNSVKHAAKGYGAKRVIAPRYLNSIK